METLLKDELGLRYDFEYEQVCDEERRDCSVRVNKGCLVVALPTLLEWLMEHKPYQQYAVSLPNDAEAIEPEEAMERLLGGAGEFLEHDELTLLEGPDAQKAMEPVLRMVADNTRLKHLDLSWNLIDARAAEAF